VLVDFRSPRRPLAGIQDYFNRKGLFSDRGERKEAFYVLRDYYRSLAAGRKPE
jgi:beta-glucuronidase